MTFANDAWRLPKGSLCSLQELANWASDLIQPTQDQPGLYVTDISAHPLFLHYGGEKPAKVRLRFKVIVKVECRYISARVSEYKQVGEGAIAWLATFCETEEQREHHVTFVPDELGRLKPSAYDVFGLAKGSKVTATVQGVEFSVAAGRHD